jgi:NAD(P)-dependent dehydrogenase (short-subunit alcohol dehydrogenase family)
VPSCRYAPWGPVIRCHRPAVTDGPFSGRVALITGASGGIGQALARRPATGGAVPGLGYSAHGQAAQALAAEITPAGDTAAAIGADLRRPQAPSQLIQAAAEALGPGGLLCWSATTG